MKNLVTGKILVITAPSGSGKTTLVKRLLKDCPELEFSISACTRTPRAGEVHGKDYYFFTPDEFRKLIADDAFIEYEMVYEGKYYGTLRTEMQRIWSAGKLPLVDIDVKGAITIHEKFPGTCKSVFIEAPSVDELRRRLQARGTETPESLEERVKKAEFELEFASKFDHIVINDKLETAEAELNQIVRMFIS
jgi:guanylate kinase